MTLYLANPGEMSRGFKKFRGRYVDFLTFGSPDRSGGKAPSYFLRISSSMKEQM
jgi:hypothetical protein